MSKVLSIVIPSYNVEKYIEKCLASFENVQVLKDLEILIVNDGSTDQTAEIAGRFVKKYPSSYRLINKENGGHGSAINCGIKQATGKYFKVVDGDDWVAKENLPHYIRLLKKMDTDVVASDYFLIQDETNKILEQRHAANNKYHYGKEWGFAEAVTEPIIKIHSLTIKTNILQEHKIEVDEKVFYEDAEYILYPIAYCKNVYYDNTPIYMYRIGRSGQSVDITSMIKRREEHMKVLESLFAYYEDHQFIQQYKRKYVERGIALSVQNQYQIYLAMGNNEEVKRELIGFDQKLKKEFPGIYEAVTKKSIWAIRHSNYRLFSIGTLIYKLMK